LGHNISVIRRENTSSPQYNSDGKCCQNIYPLMWYLLIYHGIVREVQNFNEYNIEQ